MTASRSFFFCSTKETRKRHLDQDLVGGVEARVRKLDNICHFFLGNPEHVTLMCISIIMYDACAPKSSCRSNSLIKCLSSASIHSFAKFALNCTVNSNWNWNDRSISIKTYWIQNFSRTFYAFCNDWPIVIFTQPLLITDTSLRGNTSMSHLRKAVLTFCYCNIFVL